jgi:hypothetical protein
MKRYYLEVIVGGKQPVINYTVDADGFDYGHGYYMFTVGKENRLISASFPINRTIIKKIEET